MGFFTLIDTGTKKEGGSIGITFYSKEEDRPLPMVSIHFFRKYWYFTMKKSFLKPIIRNRVNSIDGKEYPMIVSKRYGFDLEWGEYADYLYLVYGVEHDDYGSKKDDFGGCKFVDFWWKKYTFVAHRLFNFDGSVLAEGKNIENSWDYPGHEKMRFQFRDGYDEERITATAKLEEREWSRGTGWMKWLKYFYPPMIKRSLDLSFDKEVGSRKGSWKGGTVGHSIDIEKGEQPRCAMERYCSENGHYFLTVIRFPDRSWVQKNVPEDHLVKSDGGRNEASNI